jgi:hypothetical protein
MIIASAVGGGGIASPAVGGGRWGIASNPVASSPGSDAANPASSPGAAAAIRAVPNGPVGVAGARPQPLADLADAAAVLVRAGALASSLRARMDSRRAAAQGMPP